MRIYSVGPLIRKFTNCFPPVVGEEFVIVVIVVVIVVGVVGVVGVGGVAAAAAAVERFIRHPTATIQLR